MGNCTGIFSSCEGENPKETTDLKTSNVKVIDKEQMRKALAINEEMNVQGKNDPTMDLNGMKNDGVGDNITGVERNSNNAVTLPSGAVYQGDWQD